MMNIKNNNFKFAEIPFMKLRNLYNLNLVREISLQKAGIFTFQDLSKHQAIGCFLFLIEKGIPCDFKFLLQLDGAINSRNFLTYTEAEKLDLLQKLKRSLANANMKWDGINIQNI